LFVQPRPGLGLRDNREDLDLRFCNVIEHPDVAYAQAILRLAQAPESLDPTFMPKGARSPFCSTSLDEPRRLLTSTSLECCEYLVRQGRIEFPADSPEGACEAEHAETIFNAELAKVAEVLFRNLRVLGALGV
jgi:hypothetical protein